MTGLEIRSNLPADSLSFARVEPHCWDATLVCRGLTARCRVWMGQGWGAGGLYEFIADLATQWRGWDGERTWGSDEHELAIVATHDRVGTVTLRITMQELGWDDEWSATGRILLDAGGLDVLAATSRSVMADG